MRAALRAGDRVDLVDDHGLDAAEGLARGAREQQVQALRGRDEDVRRPPGELALLLGGVSPVRPAIEIRGVRLAEPLRRSPMPCSGARRLRSTS